MPVTRLHRKHHEEADPREHHGPAEEQVGRYIDQTKVFKQLVSSKHEEHCPPERRSGAVRCESRDQLERAEQGDDAPEGGVPAEIHYLQPVQEHGGTDDNQCNTKPGKTHLRSFHSSVPSDVSVIRSCSIRQPVLSPAPRAPPEGG